MAKNDKKPAEKKKKVYQIYKNYQVDGEVVKKKNKSCPKCGEGFFMAEHKDRMTCGKCGYMEKK